jgi:adenosylcobinamide-GDP ribazoletransferase
VSWARRQAVLFVVAAQFLTRLPTPRLHRFEPDWPVRASRAFPLVGQLVGALSAAVWLAAGTVWSTPISAVLATATAVLLTGGFHEDGLADTADGLGGGQTPARRLAIMKDSRIGSFGALALVSVLAVRVTALATLPPWRGALALVIAHGAGRAAAVLAMTLTPYVGDTAGAKGRPAGLRPTWAEAAFAALWGLAPLLLPPWPKACAAAALALGAGVLLLGTSRRLIGGHTGDVLGAVEQLCEASVLLGVSAAL